MGVAAGSGQDPGVKSDVSAGWALSGGWIGSEQASQSSVVSHPAACGGRAGQDSVRGAAVNQSIRGCRYLKNNGRQSETGLGKTAVMLDHGTRRWRFGFFSARR